MEGVPEAFMYNGFANLEKKKYLRNGRSFQNAYFDLWIGGSIMHFLTYELVDP